MKSFCEQYENLHSEAENKLLEIIRKHGTVSEYNGLKRIPINEKYSISESPKLSAKVMLVDNGGYEYDLWDTFFSDWEILKFLDIQIKRLGIIKHTEESSLAKEMENALNNYNFDICAFAASIPTMHPTIQQNFYRLLKECLKVMADDTRHYDDRNIASHEAAAGIISYLEENGQYIPHIYTFTVMDNSYTIRVATTIWQQLKDFTDFSVLWSWGIHKVRPATLGSQAGLAFDVNGFQYKGTVIIKLDEGADLYDICLVQDGKLTIVRSEVYFDELGSIIDDIVERRQGMSDEEYGQMVESAYSEASNT